MDEKTSLIVAIAMVLIVIPLSLVLVLWLFWRLRRKSDQPLSREMDGVVVVPVRRLSRTFPFPFGSSENGLNPRFEIAPDGLRFRIFRADHWPFTDIEQVDAPWSLFGTRIAFRARSGRSLFVDVADKVRGRELLKALPSNLPFTPPASGMRDGVA